MGRLILFPQWNLIIYLRSLGFCSKFSYTLNYLTDTHPAIILTSFFSVFLSENEDVGDGHHEGYLAQAHCLASKFRGQRLQVGRFRLAIIIIKSVTTSSWGRGGSSHYCLELLVTLPTARGARNTISTLEDAQRCPALEMLGWD